MKLFVTDYDDTLYQNDEIIKENIQSILKLKENNFLIMISTGRSYSSIKEQVIKYHIPCDYISCADGSILYDKNGKIIHETYIDNKIIPTLTEFYQKIPYEEIQFSYSNGYSNILLNDNQLLGINICLSTKNYTSKIVKNFLKLKRKYPNYNYLSYMHPNYSYLCVKPLNISKSYIIRILAKKLKIVKKDIYVIGDSSNDIEMISDYNGVGMVNSCPEILKITKKKYLTVSDYINDILS